MIITYELVTKDVFFAAIEKMGPEFDPMPRALGTQDVDGARVQVSEWNTQKGTRQIVGYTSTNGYNKRDYYLTPFGMKYA